MALTTTQLQTLKADIAAQQDPTFIGYRNAGSTGDMANWYNLNSATNVWSTRVAVSSVLDSITWANFTPTDAADNTATYTNRILAVQTKQMNLQNMLVGREFIDASKANIRVGLRDAVIALPTGTAGAATSAGGASGVSVLNACTRLATNGEKVFAVTTATTGTVTANVLDFQGFITNNDVIAALNS